MKIIICLFTLLLTGCTQFRENIERIDFKGTYEGASVGTRVYIREPTPKPIMTGFEK